MGLKIVIRAQYQQLTIISLTAMLRQGGIDILKCRDLLICYNGSSKCNKVKIKHKMDIQEEKEQGGISKTLFNGIIIFAAVILVGLIFMPKAQKQYKMTEEQMLAKIMSFDGVAGPDLIVDQIYKPSDKYQFIDLRSAPEYLKGHLPNAINIPINHIFDKQYEKLWKQKEMINLLYYSDHAGACGPWMILNQLGYTNNKIMLGGYDYVNENMIKKFGPLSGNYRDEKAKFDFAKIIGETSGGNVSSASSETDKASTAPVVKKKKEAKAGGGC